MSIFKLIQQYDNEREAYIRELEEEIEKLRSEKSEALSLMMKGERLRERVLFDAIMAGAYTKPAKNDAIQDGE